MQLNLGNKIRELRRRDGRTQDNLAEALGVTAQAVSRWESSGSYPDMEMIPAIANYFHVSIDELFGYNDDREEKIKQYLTEANDLGNEGKDAERTVLLRKANKEFPCDYKIMERLANSLICEYFRKGIKEYDEVFELCNRILAECTDSKIRYSTIKNLATAYRFAGKKEEMLKIVEEMPKSHVSYENFMLYRWSGDADFAKRQSYIAYLINHLLAAMDGSCRHRHDDGEVIYSTEDRIRLYSSQVELLENLFPDKDYQYLAQHGEIACSHIAKMLIRNKDFESAWKWLEKSVEFAIHMDTYDFDTPHTSLVLRGYIDGGWIMEKEGNRSQCMLEWLTTDDEAAALRTDARYEALVNRLKTVARKP